MFFSPDEDDQDFMSPGGGKKLASLFGIDQASSQGGNESLQYTAPKQPKKKESSPALGGQPSIVFATAVNAYKYVDGQYVNQGKLGAAILANHTSLDYRVLLYLSKEKQVTNAKITSNFSYTVQANNYGSFYDDQRQTWSLLFKDENDSIQFAKHIGLSKFNSAGQESNSLVTQDLRVGDGGTLEEGDSAEVKYTGWLLTNNSFGQEFDSNVKTEKPFRFKVGKGKVIKGWNVGVVGMKKSAKRLLVVPPSMGYGSQGAGNRIPPNATLIFEVEVTRVKLSKAESSPGPSPVPASPAPPSESPGPEAEMEEHSVKGRSRSITEQLTHQSGGSSNKAKLISRMAKMGQPMLPMVGATAAQPDSDEEPVPESPVTVSSSPAQPTVQPVVKPVVQHPPQPAVAPPQPTYQQPLPTQVIPNSVHQPAFLQNIPAAQQLSLYQPQTNLLQQQQQAALLQQQQMQMLQMQQQQQQGFQPAAGFTGMPATSMPTTAPPTGLAGDTSAPVLLTETRQQNTEIKTSMGKMSEKIDQMLEKVEQIHRQNSGVLALQSTVPNMESSVLMHNIQRIVQENDRLKKDLYEKSAKVEQQNQKISELIQSNQMIVEKNQSMMEQRNEGFQSSASQSQARVLHLEKEKMNLTTELSNVTAQLSSLQMEITEFRKKESDLHQKMDSASRGSKRDKEELDALKTQHQEDEQRIDDMKQNLKSEKQKRKQLESQISQIQEECQDAKSSNQVLEKGLADRKRKAGEEKRQMEEEFEDTKAQLEQEIQTLRDKLRKAKSSTDSVAAQQASQIEQELNEEWKQRCDKMLASAQDKHNRALAMVKEEKEELQSKVEELENKIKTLRTSSGSSDEKLRLLQEQLEEMSAWKDKYNNLRSQASSMKDKYEERISELEEEKEEVETEKEQAMSKVRTLQEEVKNKAPSGGGGGVDPSVIAIEVKKIMNTVYQRLRSEFEEENKYSGKEVLSAILNAIKETTLSLMQSSPSKEESEDEDEEEEEEEEEDEKEEAVEVEDQRESENEETEQEDEKKELTKKPESDESKRAVENTAPPPENETEKTGQDEVDVSPSPESSPQPAAELNTPNIPQIVSDKDVSVSKDDHISEPETKASEASEEILTENTASDSKENSVVNEESKTNSKSDNEFDDFEVPSFSSREPPPMDDSISDNSIEEKEDDNKPLFGDDDNLADTFGEDFMKPKTEEKSANKTKNIKDLTNEEDKSKAPPPLFPDDDDDDDLDWLS